jgi:hypothetical protein
MFDLRMYRAGLVVVVLAALVLAFSLENQQGPLSSTLAPVAFNGQNVQSTMKTMAAAYPDRRPGTFGDTDLAGQVASSFNQYGFSATISTFSAPTADGRRTLENVIGVRPGMQTGSLVIIAHRDAQTTPAIVSLSGTATLVELARDLEGETLHRTVVLASTSGSQGAAGALRLAARLGGPIDAVIVLGDVASEQVRQPIIIPWSDGPQAAPPMLINTLAAALNAQAAIGSGGTSLFGQFVHLAFPLTLTEQGPFNARGIPAVTLSLSGERGPTPGAVPAGTNQLNAVGGSVLSTISALDGGPSVPGPSSYVLFDRKVVPGWAISLFVLALIIPVLLAAIDGFARARRRHYPVWRWLIVVVCAALPFALGLAVILGAGGVGALPDAPPGAVPAGVVPLDTGGVAVMALAAVVAIGSFALFAPRALRFAADSTRKRPAEDSFRAAAAALLLLTCVVTIVIWISNPFAAALIVPALHLWLLAANSDLRIPVPLRIALVAASLLPVGGAIAYYAVTLGYGPVAAAWSGTLLIAGQVISPLAALAWSLLGGCVLVAGAIIFGLARRPAAETAPVTVRGPVTYAGPGSLGGTKSALRR